MTSTVVVELPSPLRLLARLPARVTVSVEGPVTQRSILDALEAAHPALQGTIRDHSTRLRRPFMRFFGCGEDLSHASPDEALPEAIAQGREPFLIIGAIAGG